MLQKEQKPPKVKSTCLHSPYCTDTRRVRRQVIVPSCTGQTCKKLIFVILCRLSNLNGCAIQSNKQPVPVATPTCTQDSQYDAREVNLNLHERVVIYDYKPMFGPRLLVMIVPMPSWHSFVVYLPYPSCRILPIFVNVPAFITSSLLLLSY